MQEYHADAAAADDLIGQMLADGVMYKNDDGTLMVMGADGNMKSYSP